MQAISFEEGLANIVMRDPRYQRDAYLFLREALEHTQKIVPRKTQDEERHVTGQELLAGIRDYALKQFGPMTTAVFEAWGLRSCEDFGELVFNLVAHNLLKKTEQDSREDFRGGYDFFTAFQKPFLPQSHARSPAPLSEIK